MIHKHKGKKNSKPEQGTCNPAERKKVDFGFIFFEVPGTRFDLRLDDLRFQNEFFDFSIYDFKI